FSSTKIKKAGVIAVIHAASSVQFLEQKIRTELYSKGLVARFSFDDIAGQSPLLLQTIQKARSFSKSDATVLLTGESGTGKELFVHSIHQASSRRNGPFVAINSASLPEHLLESELFGYEEGAFTGARKGGKLGFFELAHNGTLFLDEISEITPRIQTSLLRVLQTKQVIRIGGSQVIPVDVRIIAAVNKNLKELVKKGEFRQDLFYRLNILGLNIPPLRERLIDIPFLARLFQQNIADHYSKSVIPFSERVYLAFQSYKWPGNIRELENLVEKYVVICDDTYTLETAEELAFSLLREDLEGESDPAKPTLTIPIASLQEMENSILSQMEQLINDKNHLAQMLDVSRSTLWRKLKQACENDPSREIVN
ncbi:MAG: sigma 54-interacting transcriptional regulator, partial [Syntrophomonadaceae bacterium]|nr:sigma 54-interacting transcriptional regulator [Syntrophomonadaceae bacterium]